MQTHDQYTTGFGYYTNESAFPLSRYWAPTGVEFFNASMAQAFDRTSGKRFAENLSITSSEQEAREAGELQVYENEDAFKNSEFYRPGIQFSSGMNNVRARILSENYDKRREWERVIQGGDDNGPWWYTPLGFGAGIIGSIPDPINLIPFSGGGITGARLAGMSARQVLSQSLKRGAFEGAVGNFISSGYAAADLNKKGENMGAQDILLDTVFGGIAGPVFHGAGAFISRGRARAGMRTNTDALIAALDDDSPFRGQFADTFSAMQRGEADAYRTGGTVANALDDQGFIRELRQSVKPQERMELARALELAMDDIANDRPINLAPLRETLSNSRAEGMVRRELAAMNPESNERIVREGPEANELLEKNSANSPPDGSGDGNASPRFSTRQQADLFDWRTETSPDTPPLMEATDLDAAARESAINPDAISPEEAQLAGLAEQGRLSPQDTETLMSHAQNRAYLDRMEDAALSTIDCIMRIGS